MPSGLNVDVRLADGQTAQEEVVPPASLAQGTATLVAGVSPAIPVGAALKATTQILVSVKTMTPGAGNLTVQYAALAADRVVGTSFKITALIAAGTINVNDISVVDWFLVN